MFLDVLSVENWDMFEQVIDHTYKRYVQSESQEHPVMMSEASVSIFTVMIISNLPFDCNVPISEGKQKCKCFIIAFCCHKIWYLWCNFQTASGHCWILWNYLIWWRKFICTNTENLQNCPSAKYVKTIMK